MLGDRPGEIRCKVSILNKKGENLVGILEDNGSSQIILCHGFRSSKENGVLTSLSSKFLSMRFSTFRFDFSGSGESEGYFQYGSYWKDAEDLSSVVTYWRDHGRKVDALVGHSKGSVEYRVMKDSLKERFNTDMETAMKCIPNNCSVLTVHGSNDETVNCKEAGAFDKLIPNPDYCWC
ncbi:hypothetical protein KP509_21G018100 [Ceratopteris richardii]|uniref:Serine aminopeptidase S33 domain-containing protein n=1 Tax=Ceratopteris richardii TaxID=49495 RepID=A0A8T2S7T2_CERRI|nr:hypothetical protein KP509_21G018100 [Ceratopteris richardii]